MDARATERDERGDVAAVGEVATEAHARDRDAQRFVLGDPVACRAFVDRAGAFVVTGTVARTSKPAGSAAIPATSSSRVVVWIGIQPAPSSRISATLRASPRLRTTAAAGVAPVAARTTSGRRRRSARNSTGGSSRPQRDARVQLVGEHLEAVRPRDPERFVLLALPAQADAEVEPAAAHRVERRRGLRRAARPGARRDEDPGREPDPFGAPAIAASNVSGSGQGSAGGYGNVPNG